MPPPRNGLNKGFTLAEVLITLGIIGIVAAITLPTLINNIQDKQFKTAFKKQYSVISQAMQKVYSEEGLAFESNSDWIQMPRYFCFIQNELKILNSGIACPKNPDSLEISSVIDWPRTGKYYWHETGEWYNKQGQPQILNIGYRHLSYLLQDGALVVHNCLNQIFVDVNGYKKPNTIGRDIFYFVLQDNSTLPTFFGLNNGNVNVNGCSGDKSVKINKDNYKEDCTNGSGWGCSPLYILD